MKTDLFQSCGHCWVFQLCWHIECSTLSASSFRILNSSAGIPLPPLALFVLRLPKAHLTSDSRMSNSRWVTTPSWLSGSLRQFFCYSSSGVFLPPLFSLLHLLGPYRFCPLSCPFLHEISPWYFQFSWWWESQFPGRLIRSPGVPEEWWVRGSRREDGVWNSQGGGKDNLFLFFIFLYIS